MGKGSKKRFSSSCRFGKADETAVCSNQQHYWFSIHATFLSFRFKIDKTVNKNKGFESIRKQISTLFKILQHADASLVFSHYESETIFDDETGLIPTPQSKILDDPENIPTSLTELRKFVSALGLLITETLSGLKFDSFIQRKLIS